MSRSDMGEADRLKRRRINTILIIISGILLIAGVIFLLIEPYKAWKRSQITDDAMNIIHAESILAKESALQMAVMFFFSAE